MSLGRVGFLDSASGMPVFHNQRSLNRKALVIRSATNLGQTSRLRSESQVVCAAIRKRKALGNSESAKLGRPRSEIGKEHNGWIDVHIVRKSRQNELGPCILSTTKLIYKLISPAFGCSTWRVWNESYILGPTSSNSTQETEPHGMSNKPLRNVNLLGTLGSIGPLFQ